MNTDAYYEIGSSHRVCEDYALAGQYEDMAYAIVSDGCSSSEDSDIGARLLSHIAKGVLIYLRNRDRDIFGSPSFTEIFRELVVMKCKEVKRALGLPTDVFDATLLVGIIYKDKIICHGWGDGYFTLVTKNNTIIIYGIRYSSGAPYYISYDLSPEKKEAYWQRYGENDLEINSVIIGPDGNTISNSINKSPLTDSYALYKEAHAPSMKSLTISSDGLDTYQLNPKFILPENSVVKDYSDITIIPAMVSYKSTIGEFVIRKMQRLKSDFEKEHVIHIDDVSCASIVL